MPTIGGARYDDIQTVFASLHSHPEADGYFGPTNNVVLANAYYTLNAFSSVYNLNYIGFDHSPLTLGIAIGRYLGDVYNGGCSYSPSVCPAPCLGQPWFLATLTMAELIYEAVNVWKTSSIVVDSTNIQFFEYFNIKSGKGTYPVGTPMYKDMMIRLIHAADSFISRVQFHTDVNFRLDEQYNADTGRMMSAGDLVWSYAALVTADRIRAVVNPASTIASYITSNTIRQEFIISDYDLTYDGMKPVYRITGNIAVLDNWVLCGANSATLIPSARRCRNNTAGVNKCDFSLMVTVPIGVQIEWKMYRSNMACTVSEWAVAPDSLVLSTNNGLYATSASWTRSNNVNSKLTSLA